MLSNIVEVFVHFWTELRGVKRVTARGDITVFRGTYKFDNFYFKISKLSSKYKSVKIKKSMKSRKSIYKGGLEYKTSWFIAWYFY